MSWDILNEIYGTKPKVADYENVNLTAEQRKALEGNLANFDLIAQLSKDYSALSMQQMDTLMPGYSGLLASGAKTSQSILDAAAPLLKGEIPQDVQDKVLRSSAYQSLMGGYAGSGMSKALTARDLGRTSLDLLNQGTAMGTAGGNSAQLWSNMARGNMLNPGSMLIDPAMQAGITTQNNMANQAVQQFRYNVAAAPDPAAMGVKNDFMSLLGMAVSAYTGGASKGYTAPTSAQQYQGSPLASSSGGYAPSYNYGMDLYGYGGRQI